MTDMISRAAAIALVAYDSDGDPAGQFDHHIFVKLSDLSALPAAQVAVKPLEWEHHPMGWLAAPPTGQSYIIDVRVKGRVMFIKGMNPPPKFDNLEAAKAAAQADYDARIRAALTITPAPDPAQIRESALREAAHVADEHYARGGMGNPGHHILTLIAALPATQVKTATPDYTLGASELSLPAVSDDVAAMPTTAAERDVLVERSRQCVVEGWTPAHDDEHGGAEMAIAAACYALSASGWSRTALWEIWPKSWGVNWFKPNYTSPRRDLVKAGALIIAEIERIDRAALARLGGVK